MYLCGYIFKGFFMWSSGFFLLIFYIMKKDTFWGRAKPLIKALNMTQQQFADYLGISYYTLRGWIYHERTPEILAAYNVAIALGVTLDYLLVGKDRDIAGKRLMEIETRKAAARVMKLADQIHEEISQMRPLG